MSNLGSYCPCGCNFLKASLKNFKQRMTNDHNPKKLLAISLSSSSQLQLYYGKMIRIHFPEYIPLFEKITLLKE